MEYHDLPQPENIPVREKEDAMGAYLMMFASTALGLPLPIINLIAAVIYFFVNKSKSKFIHFHALQSLISQLPLTVTNMGVTYWTVHNFWTQSEFTNNYFGYLATVFILNITYFILSIIAATKARKGRFYYFVFFGRIAYHYAYRVKEGHREIGNINKPPM